MTICRLSWQQLPPAACQRGAVAIGNFDGVHRGHAALLAELHRQATTIHGPTVVLTLDPHPLQLLRPQQFLPVLTTMEDRAELLQAHGVDHVIVLQTTFELLQLSAADFFERVIRTSLGARTLVEGENFGFGHNREGDVRLLSRLCEQAGLSLVIVPPFAWQGVTVSSSRVRAALERGDVRGAAALLGRPYRLRGFVGLGQQRGKTLGFPTANLENIATVQPANGVYAVRVPWQGRVWPGAAHIGPNPTFGEQVRKIEVHLIGFQGDLYGQSLAVDFIDRLRDTRSFAGIADLVAQLRLDIEQASGLAQTESVV